MKEHWKLKNIMSILKIQLQTPEKESIHAQKKAFLRLKTFVKIT